MVLIAAIMTYFVDKANNDAGKSPTLPASKIIIEVNINSIVHFR